MYGEGVLVVLNCWRRPQNLPTLIKAWRGQSVKPRQVVVVDNSPQRGTGDWAGQTEAYPYYDLHGADDVWRWQTNLGCFAHLAPALMLTGHCYVLLADDDVLPGCRALEHLLTAAAKVQDRFATIGGVGRLFLMDRVPGERYSGRSCPTRNPDGPAVTHLTCQAHLVRADMMHHVLTFRDVLLRWGHQEQLPVLVDDLCKVHDDFLLCCGIQQMSRLPSYLTPLEVDDPEKALVKDRLPGHSDATAVWRRDGHFAERARMVELVLAAGWRPVDPANGTNREVSNFVRIGDEYDVKDGYEIE